MGDGRAADPVLAAGQEPAVGAVRAAEMVRAAGAVVCRAAGSGMQVALVHRPKYDDWSFPKGKLEPGEHVLLAAVREVAEETGMRVTLGRRLPSAEYDNAGVLKRVDYWVAAPEAGIREFSPNCEIDGLVWSAASKASTRLTYRRDIETLALVRHGPRLTSPLILVRHASAGAKARWGKDDMFRPLDSQGAEDAKLLARLFRCFGNCRVVSSPAERSIATVRPYAEFVQRQIEIETAFRVDGEQETSARIAEIAALLAADERPVVICAHRENLPTILAAACTELKTPAPHESPLRKGEFLVLHRAAGRLAGFERHSLADDS